MIALTVRPPWSYAIAAGLKPIENRTWKTTHRGPLAIHAGARFDYRGQRRIIELARRAVLNDYVSAVVAVVELADIHHSSTCQRTGRHAALHPDGPFTCSPWAVGGDGGMWHWELADVRRLREPVACKGRLGLWPLTPVGAEELSEVERAVLAHIGANA